MLLQIVEQSLVMQNKKWEAWNSGSKFQLYVLLAVSKLHISS